jgi:hypothetical protein
MAANTTARGQEEKEKHLVVVICSMVEQGMIDRG